MAENVPKLKKINIWVQGAQTVPNKINQNRPTQRHIIIKMAKVKDKERILKVARRKTKCHIQGYPHKVIS